MERNITKLQAGQEGEILLLVQEVEKAVASNGSHPFLNERITYSGCEI